MNVHFDPEEIFFHALGITSPAERAAYLTAACGDNAGLRHEVESMLADHRQADAFFTEADAAITLPDGLLEVDPDRAADDTDIGATLGRYRLVGRLGEGGEGTVFEAEQTHPVRRKIALKILKLGMDTRRVIARFEAERQTLALMEHPNIAHVIDAGATATGRPYFVMELVHGARITDYCRLNRLSLEARLELIQLVCAAVQHAHQKGVIHRDLKPSNILVSIIDGVPVPKIIDFGIARVTAGHDKDATRMTMPGQPVGTPAYMSPEQVLGDAADIDTRSDIYSLGVVLYELLAGRPPLGNEELLHAGLDEMRRRLRDEEPLRPSCAAGETGDGPSPAQLKGDLDWIVMKAIAKDREQRYQTVRTFSEDIGRYLADEPIEARPPGNWYRLRKLIRRNRLASAAIAFAVLTLAGGFTTSSLLFLKARSAECEQTRLRAEAEEREHVTKAAILLMQGKPWAANDEVERINGTLTQPSLEATSVFRNLAIWSAMHRDLHTAGKRLLALSRVNRFDASDMTDNATRDLLPIAPTLITTGELDAYHDFTRLVISRLGRTNNPIASEHVLKICLQLPPDPKMLAELIPVARVCEQSLASLGAAPVTQRLDAWRCGVLALWHYRNNRFETALKWCDRGLQLHDKEQVRACFILAVRAMASARLGRLQDARADFTTARTITAPKYPKELTFDDGGGWNDWLTVRILLKEARQAINAVSGADENAPVVK